MLKTPSLLLANLAYLASYLLIVTVGALLQLQSLSLGLIATEILAILIPALIVLRVAGLPARETLRLRWPGGRVAALTVLLGAGVWLVAAWIDSLASALLGYSAPVTPDFFPTTALAAALFFVALAILPPVCEEILFRGVLQRAYERYGPALGITAVAVLFAFWHGRFQGLLALFPVAFVLGYVVWRSDSLVTGMLIHFTNNALAAAFVIVGTARADLQTPVGSLPAAAAGAALAAVCLWLIRRATVPSPPVEPPTLLSWARRALAITPLAFAALLYVFLAGAELLIGRFPEVMAFEPAALGTAPWDQPVQWRYELRNIVDAPVGQAECRLTPAADAFALDCSVHQNAFEASSGASTFKADATDTQRAFRWRRSGLQLAEGREVAQSAGGRSEFTVAGRDGGLILAVSRADGTTQDLPLPAGAFVTGEWPWRVPALSFSVGYSGKATLAWPNRWRSQTQDNGPVELDTALVVRTAEPVWTPAGSFVTWRVTLGDQEAWYDVQPPHTLVRYDDGVVSYLLVEAR